MRSKEENKAYMKAYMSKRRNVNIAGVNTDDVNTEGEESKTQEGVRSFFKDGKEYVPASYVSGLDKKYKSLPERPRFLTLSDGQVLDRLNPPVAIPQTRDFISCIQRCNDTSYGFKPVR